MEPPEVDVDDGTEVDPGAEVVAGTEVLEPGLKARFSVSKTLAYGCYALTCTASSSRSASCKLSQTRKSWHQL